MSNNFTVKNPKKSINSTNEIIQITENFDQLNLKNDNYFNEIVKELYNKYNEEGLKSSDLDLIINSLDQILVKKKQNPDNIINWCLDNQNNPMVQIVLARCYRFGKWIEKNELKAFIHYQKSADMEFADGIYGVGVCYDIGIGVNKDENMTFTHYQKAANMGHIFGTFNVGSCYEDGTGVERDEHKSFCYYLKSADMGFVNGIYNVGYCYQNGIGVETDEHKAFNYFKKAANMGYADAINFVGHCYLTGYGVEIDEYKAFIYYKKLAEL